MKNRKPWNKGLTKETDERVKKYGINCSKTKKGKPSGTEGKHWKIRDTSKMKETKNFLGHKHTEESKQKNREKHIGTKQTEKTKQKRAESRKLFFQNGGIGGMKNKKQTEKTKEKIREWQINHPNKKFSNTIIEQKIAAELIKRGIHFQQNIGLANVANVDFYLPEYHVVIECDGCYYHGCPIHHPRERKETREADRRKTELLKYHGFNVYRFWEHEINESAEKCINKIKF